MTLYKRIAKTVNTTGFLVPETDDTLSHVTDTEVDWYESTFLYNQHQKDMFDIDGSIAGVTDVVTKKLWWDFDSEFEPEQARQSAIRLVERLGNLGIDYKDIYMSFSGGKGYGVEVNLNSTLLPKEAKSLAFDLAAELPHFDVKVYNASRILRVLGTKHQKTGLYKTPLTYNQLFNLTTDQIMTLSKDYPENSDDFRWSPVSLPAGLLKSEKVEVTKPVVTDAKFNIEEIDFGNKVKGWTNCKWALLNGYGVKQGNRHEQLLCIISQSKALNNTKEQAYYNAKMADEYGTEKYGGVKVSKDDIWRDVESVYDGSWKGGTFTCKEGKTTWLKEICDGLGPYKCKHNEMESLVDVDKVFDEFFTYAKDIEKNTIKTGIADLDKNLRLRTGQMVGILGAPSSGKTALALEILENTSRQGLLSVFYSLDMASSELFQKIAQRVTGFEEDYLYKTFQTNPKESAEIGNKVKQAYQNVKFCFDTGVSVEKASSTIEEFEGTTNKKVKLLLLDYNELLSSPYSDMTASSGYNAGALKKLTNSKQLCTISLLQPPKVIGDASDEILSYRNIKGSSLLEQCFSTIVGIYRPGFSAENDSEDDHYMVMNVLKNRLGKLFSLSFYWEGLKGKISSIDDFGRKAIKDLKEKNKSQGGDLNF